MTYEEMIYHLDALCSAPMREVAVVTTVLAGMALGILSGNKRDENSMIELANLAGDLAAKELEMMNAEAVLCGKVAGE